MKQRSLGQHHVLSIFLTALIVALGWFAERWSVAFDLTANARHSLTPSSVAVTRALDRPLEVTAVLGSDPAVREAVRALIERYQALNPLIALEFVNPETDPGRARALEVSAGGELILISGEREQRLRQVSERAFTGALRRLSRQSDRRIAFISGHGERSPLAERNDDWSIVADRLASSGLVCEEYSLVTQPVLSDDIDVVVLAAPRRPFFPGEQASLERWLDAGGNLLWMIEPDTTPDPLTGLAPLAAQLGISVLPGTIIDTASQAMQLGAPDFVVLDSFPAHPVTRILANPVLLPGSAAFAVTPLAGQTEHPLLETPSAAWTETSPLAGRIEYNSDTIEQDGPLLAAVAIERQINARTQRIAFVGDTDFGASQFVDNGANLAFVESLLLWLDGDSSELDFISQPPPDATLKLSRRDIIALSAGLLGGLPLACLVVSGILLWRRRRWKSAS